MDMFNRLDKDGSGTLTKAELAQGLAAMRAEVVMRRASLFACIFAAF